MEYAWPSGVPQEETAIAAGLDAVRAGIARTRLRALLAHEAGATDWQGAAEEVGLDRTSFYELASAWKAHRSLASIVPHVRAYRTTTKRDDGLRRHVARALKRHPKCTRRALAEIVRGEMASPPGLTTIEGVVDQVRIDVEREALGGEKGFGRKVVIDACPATMRIGGIGKDAEQAVAWTAFVVDVATSTVIAASAACFPYGAMALACGRAAIRVEALKSEATGAPNIEVHPRGDAMQLLRETGRLMALGFDVRPSTGRRSEQSRAAMLVGRRFGPVTLKARLEVPASSDRMRDGGMSDADMMDARLDAEAGRHWAKWVGDALPSSVSPRRLAKALRAVANEAATSS